MEIVTVGAAGTMESSDIIVRVEPRKEQGVVVNLESSVMQQFGKQIEKVILETLSQMNVTHATVNAVDKGALDCTIKARVSTAVYRAAKSDNYVWSGGSEKCRV